jgi:glycosyltransferase involved in cell wall biosynthesis
MCLLSPPVPKNAVSGPRSVSARLPVVATAVGDIPIMVAEENRPFIVERDVLASLVAALARLCHDASLRRSVGMWIGME